MSDTPASNAKRLGLYSLSFLRQPDLRKILALLGFHPVTGPMSARLEAVAIWGNSAAAERGRRAAKRRSVPLLHLEEPFLRSLSQDDAPLTGILLDHKAHYADASRPSDLEDLLQSDVTSQAGLKVRAKEGLKLLKTLKLSKYNAWNGHDLPKSGFVLVIDQARGDASIGLGKASAKSFKDMLAAAKANHRTLPIYIRPHPRASQGHFNADDLDERTQFLPSDLNPWDVLQSAEYVYAVTSQMGMEAIFAGHRPRLFGVPFYAGWGLSEDQIACPRRVAKRTAEQLFAATYLLYPKWFDADRAELSDFETTARQLARQRDHWQRHRQPTVFLGVRKWKQARVAAFLGKHEVPSIFVSSQSAALRSAAAQKRRLVVWASKEADDLQREADKQGVELWRVEDGFLRSVGLGANLYPALSLVFDDMGIYYDPSRPSRLEKLIERAASLDHQKRKRVQAVMQKLRQRSVTKYNQGNPMPTIPARQDRTVILVPGQVEDDASILAATGKVRTNFELLRHVREANPDAFVIFKPHPDVEAELRPGALPDLPEGLVDLIARDVNPADALAHADEVWTMTSLMGFEALIRGKKVTTLGAPFYAGWGLTQDLGPPVYRRRARPSLEGLVHAALIDYPDYINPDTGRITSVEATLDLLSAESSAKPMRPLARLQRRVRKVSWIWRR